MSKVLFFDIETAPNMSYVWGHWKQNVIAHERPWYIMCFGYRWEHENKTKVISLTDYPGKYSDDPEDDTYVLAALWQLLDEADIVIGHNGDRFDLKKANARMIINGLKPYTPVRSVDTLKVARKHFKFNQNSLAALGEVLELGEKVSTGGFELWKGCMAGEMSSWKKMARYCKQDVDLLMDVYYALRPWMNNHPTTTLVGGGKCPTCSSDKKMQRRGFRYTKTMKYQRWQCKECTSYCQSRASEQVERPEYVA